MPLDRKHVDGVDLDWFAIDGYGFVGHFATGGFGPVPTSVEKNALDVITEYFRTRALICSEVVESPGWEQAADVPVSDVRRRELYLRDYSFFAARGLFSYSTPGNWEAPLHYFRVTMPEPPLRVSELPLEIRDPLSRVCLDRLSFADKAQVFPPEMGSVIDLS
jgi:hypothetical protein